MDYTCLRNVQVPIVEWILKRKINVQYTSSSCECVILYCYNIVHMQVSEDANCTKQLSLIYVLQKLLL